MPKGTRETGKLRIDEGSYRDYYSSSGEKGEGDGLKAARVKVGDNGIKRALKDKKYRESTDTVSGFSSTNDFSEAVEMVKKKKTASRSAY